MDTAGHPSTHALMTIPIISTCLSAFAIFVFPDRMGRTKGPKKDEGEEGEKEDDDDNNDDNDDDNDDDIAYSTV